MRNDRKTNTEISDLSPVDVAVIGAGMAGLSTQPGMFQVSLGVRIDPEWGLQDLPGKVNLPLAKLIIIDGRERTRLAFYQYSHNPSMAP